VKLRRGSRWAVIGITVLAVLAGYGRHAMTSSYAGATTYSLWTDTDVPAQLSDPDNQAVELGLRFSADRAGTISAVRFYKAAANTGVHTGSLWSVGGARLATVTFTNESASGWQRASFPQPVAVSANEQYVVSYHTTVGHYSGDNGYFDQPRDRTPLHAPASTGAAPNGLYRYGASGFPTSTFGATNYWVDVEFSATDEPSAKPSPSASPSASQPPPGDGYPDADSSGVPSGVQLSDYTGSCDFRTDNQVVEAKRVNCGGILVYAKNVTFRNSVISSAIMTNADGASVRVEDSDVDAGETSWGAVGGSNLTVIGSELTGGQHSVLCGGNCLVQDSYLHGQYNDPNASFHNNAFISNGGAGMVIRHNTVWCSATLNANDGGCTADVSLFGDFDRIADVTVDANYFHATAGGYCGTFGYNPAKPFGSDPTGVVVSNNVFERGTTGQCGEYGPVTSFLTTGAGNLWSNNTWVDGGAVTP
jgi:hypothetical protein